MGLWEKLIAWKGKESCRCKVPTVLQMEATECGAACLAMVLAYYGQWVPLEEFRTSYTGVALYVEPGEGFCPEGKRYNVFTDIFRKLFRDKWAALFVLILELCAIVPGLATPVMNQIFMDDILTKKHPDWMFKFCLAMTLAFVLSGLMAWLRAVVLTTWQRKLTLADSSGYFWHLLRLPMQFFQQRYAAEVAGRVGFNQSIAEVLSGPAATALLDLLVALFYLLLLLQYSVTLTLIGIAFSSVEIILFFAMRRHLTDLNMRMQQDAAKAYGVAMNGLRMIETIKANGDEGDFFAKWSGYQTKVLAASQKTTLWSLSVRLLPTLLAGVNSALMHLPEHAETKLYGGDRFLLCSLFAGVIPLVTPIITETVFEDIIPILDWQGLATVTQALMVTSFTTAALSVVRSIAVLRISNRIEMSAEAAMWGRLLSLPAGFFRKFTAGELASRMGGIGIAKNLASGEFVEGILSFLFSFWSIFLMSYYSWELTSTAVAIWLLYGLFIAFVYRRVLFFQRKIIAAGNKNAGTVQQIFAGLAKFRVQGAEEQAYSLWARDFGESWNWNLRLRWQNNYTSIIGSVQPFILTMVLYCVAVYGMEILGPNGQVETGLSYAQFIAFNAAYSSFNAVMGGCIKLVGQYFGIQPQLENLRPILQAEPENTGDKQDAGRITGQLEVSHLSFAYPDPQTGEWGTEVLHDVNFSIAAGENVAIVGKSGSGKSTLVRLLLGFEQPKSGGIYFDGQDLAGLNLPSVRSQLGVVLQNGQLMTGDIYTNIVGTRLLTQQAAWEAAAAAGIDEDIAAMPMGMQTVISEGSSNISGGQRQRILIARALVAKPSLVIFDEATSALDNRSQAIVTESLDKLKATRIVVAHRLSTIRGCDRIIVIDEGRVAEQGTFDELLARQGIFADLVKRQVA